MYLSMAMLLISAGQSPEAIKLDRDVYDIDFREFMMPLNCTRKDKVDHMRLYVSTDRGKNWCRQEDYRPTDDWVRFKAGRDGLYWFAVQIVQKNGKRIPRSIDDLKPARKVYVNSAKRPVKRRTPTGDEPSAPAEEEHDESVREIPLPP